MYFGFSLQQCNTKWYLTDSVTGVHFQDSFLSCPDWGALTMTNDVVYIGYFEPFIAAIPRFRKPVFFCVQLHGSIAEK